MVNATACVLSWLRPLAQRQLTDVTDSHVEISHPVEPTRPAAELLTPDREAISDVDLKAALTDCTLLTVTVLYVSSSDTVEAPRPHVMDRLMLGRP